MLLLYKKTNSIGKLVGAFTKHGKVYFKIKLASGSTLEGKEDEFRFIS